MLQCILKSFALVSSMLELLLSVVTSSCKGKFVTLVLTLPFPLWISLLLCLLPAFLNAWEPSSASNFRKKLFNPQDRITPRSK